MNKYYISRKAIKELIETSEKDLKRIKRKIKRADKDGDTQTVKELYFKQERAIGAMQAYVYVLSLRNRIRS